MFGACRLPKWVDTVDKVGDEMGCSPIGTFADRLLAARVEGAIDATPRLTLNTTNGHARYAADRFGGGRQM
jgi:hypothetical protein